MATESKEGFFDHLEQRFDGDRVRDRVIGDNMPRFVQAYGKQAADHLDEQMRTAWKNEDVLNVLRVAWEMLMPAPYQVSLGLSTVGIRDCNFNDASQRWNTLLGFAVEKYATDLSDGLQRAIRADKLA